MKKKYLVIVALVAVTATGGYELRAANVSDATDAVAAGTTTANDSGKTATQAVATGETVAKPVATTGAAAVKPHAGRAVARVAGIKKTAKPAGQSAAVPDTRQQFDATQKKSAAVPVGNRAGGSGLVAPPVARANPTAAVSRADVAGNAAQRREEQGAESIAR